MTTPQTHTTDQQSTILKWTEINKRRQPIPIYPGTNCPVCKSPMSNHFQESHYDKSSYNKEWKHKCYLCGWFINSCESKYVDFCGGDENAYEDSYSMSLLKELPINSFELEIAEVATYLKTNHSDIYSLSWWSFEKLIHDIFCHHGYNAVLTQKTHDDGADILIYNKVGTNLISIVECKKNSAARKVGVHVLRALVGASIEWNVKKVYLATSSDFTSGSRKMAIDYKKNGYEIDLLAASEIFNMLEVYNENLPPLQEMTKEIRNDLLKKNLLIRQ